MPVVVNEFEVVADPAQERTASTLPAATSQAASPPPDIEPLLSQRRARERRVRAY